MASTYLSRTNTTATNPYKGTFSFWSKRSALGGNDTFIISGFADASNRFHIKYDGSDVLDINNIQGGTTNLQINTNRKFRDVNAWYHIVVAIDTTQATSSDRVKIYVNGVQETSFSTATYPAQNSEMQIFKAGGVVTDIGQYGGGSYRYDGYMAHIHHTDGTAYDASTFGEFDSNGVWKPKTAPSVTYGNNGFFLKFENSSNMDLDSSPNNHTFTTSGSLTQTLDTPSNVYATLNPLNNYFPNATYSYGNTRITTSASAPVMSTLGASKGKWYWETKVISLASNYSMIGITGTQATASTQFLSNNANEYAYYSQGNLYYQGGSTGTYASYTAGDIIGVAMDLDNNRLFFSKNGTWQNSADPTTSTGAYTITAPASTSLGNYFPAITYWDDNTAANGTYEVNFGNGYFGTTAVSSAGSNGNGSIFEFDCPSGYYALNLKNLATYG